MNNSRHKDFVQPYPRAYTDSPRSSHRPDASTRNPSSNSKPPPTGPRAHKRPRLLEPHPSPPARPMAPLPSRPQVQNHSHHPHPHSRDNQPPPTRPMRDQGRQTSRVQEDIARHNKMNINDINSPNPQHNSKMEPDGTNLSRPASPDTLRERDRAREREKNNKERERRDRESRGINPNTMSTALPSKPPLANTAGRRNGNNYSNVSGRPAGGVATSAGAGTGRKATHNTSTASDSRTLQERMGL